MEREDFNSSVDWVIYKVTGKMPNVNVGLEKHLLPKSERVNDVKFYYNKHTGRYGALYDNNFLCTCKKEEIKDVQNQFDKEYDGHNLEEVTLALKTRFNMSRRYQTYKDGTLRFTPKNGRLTAHINHECKTHTICSCYPSQREEVTEKFNTLRKTRDLESIKKIMKNQYNIIGKNNRKPLDVVYTIDENGTIYKNGRLYGVVNQLVQE
jgi:hypothetical protein